MPETSIIVKAEDRYSNAVKSMSAATKPLNKDIEALQNHLDRLGKNKVSLQVDAQKARRELQALQKQFASTGNEADGLKVELAQANYDNIQRNLRLVTQEARSVEKQMASTAGAVRKTENSLSGGSGAILGGMAANMLAQAANQLAQQGVGALASSAFGAAGGNIASSAVSSAISMGTAGFLLGGAPGAAIGAAIGGITGAASGGLQNFQARDDAFKSYVQETAEGQLSERESAIASGSAIAGSREQTLLAFAQRFGSEDAARDYLAQVKTFAANTNYGYDEITGYSKKLLNTYGAEEVFDVLKKLSDASAGLNLSSSDVDIFISGLSRMRTTGKATQEYLNYFSERGVDVYQALANATGADKKDISGMVTKGKISGSTAAQAILDFIDETFGGLSDKLTGTYTAMVNNLEDARANAQEAYGIGYNEARKKGIRAETDWQDSGAMDEVNKALGAFQASLDNEKERLIREAQKSVLESDEYKKAMAAGTDEGYAEAGRLLMAAKIQAQNEYNDTDGAKLLLQSEKTLIQMVRADTALKDEYWQAGYDLSQEFSKGRAAGLKENKVEDYLELWGGEPPDYSEVKSRFGGGSAPGYAYGLNRVPYDNFPALLHEGERVLTAQQARAQDAGGGGKSFSFHIDNITVGAGSSQGEAAEVAEAVAQIVYEKVMLSQ